jgi:hypothetical protein
VAMLGLPDAVRACLFDLNGVLTDTARLHAAAWKEMFDRFLEERARSRDEPFVPFDPVADYARYVDGEPREDGVRSFLSARGIELPAGSESDPASAVTVAGLAKRKNEIVLGMISEEGASVVPGSLPHVRQPGGVAGVRPRYPSPRVRPAVSDTELLTAAWIAAGHRLRGDADRAPERP